MMLLCQTILLTQNIDKFLSIYKELNHKITAIMNQI